MKKIYKYQIEVTGFQKIEMPKGAEIICVQAQNTGKFEENICLWAIVNINEKRVEERRIEIYGTGHSMPDIDRKYIGTVQMSGGSLVFNVFELLVK